MKRNGFSLIELMISVVILSVVMGIVANILSRIQRTYRTQQQAIEAQNNARAAIDMMTRLIRMAGNDPEDINFQAINPDPDGNNALDSIQVRADWNPGDGALDDPYEDVTFTVSGGAVYIKEASDPSPVELAKGIGSMTFRYFTSTSVLIATPIASAGTIAFTEITMQTNVTGASTTFRSAASIRRRENS